MFSILLRRAFGASADSVLAQSRRAYTTDITGSYIKETVTLFPATEINSEIRKLSDVGDDFIEDLLYSQKDSRYSFPILAMLYPDLDYRNNNFHQDHLHPASAYNDLEEKDKEKYGWQVYNSILNLQMLDANENESKTPNHWRSGSVNRPGTRICGNSWRTILSRIRIFHCPIFLIL